MSTFTIEADGITKTVDATSHQEAVDQVLIPGTYAGFCGADFNDGVKFSIFTPQHIFIESVWVRPGNANA